MKDQLTKHHILPQSRGGSNADDNLILLKNSYHQALHRIFENKTIDEQIIQLVELSKSSLRQDIVEEIFELLGSRDKEDYYKDRCKKYGVILDPKY